MTPNFKSRRLFKKTELRNRKELSEGTTYATDIGLFQTLNDQLPIADISEN